MRASPQKTAAKHEPVLSASSKAIKPAAPSPSILPAWAYHTLPIQTSLKINSPGDRYEEEADRVAEQVMRMPDTAVQRKTCACGKPVGPGGMCEDCKRRQKEEIQRMAAGDVPQAAAPSIVNQVTGQPGRPLDGPTRNFMEARFGRNFDQVRMHTDSQAAKSAEELNAKAYTTSNHIVFGAGQYSPHESAGKQLIAHELAHVIQQDQTGESMVQRYTDAEIEECPCLDWTLLRMNLYAESMVAGGSLSGREHASAFMDQFLEEDTSDAFVPFSDVQANPGGRDAINVVTNRLINEFVEAGEGLDCDTPTTVSRSASTPGHFSPGTDLFYAMGAFNIRASGSATVTKICYDGQCEYIEIEVDINYRIDDLYDWKVDPGGCTPATGEDGCTANMKEVNLPVLGQICDECLNRLVIHGWAAEFMVKVRGSIDDYYDSVDCGHRYADDDVHPRLEER